jgi:hypothetical protein
MHRYIMHAAPERLNPRARITHERLSHPLVSNLANASIHDTPSSLGYVKRNLAMIAKEKLAVMPHQIGRLAQ